MKTCEFCNNSFKDTYLTKHKKTAKYCIELQKSKNLDTNNSIKNERDILSLDNNTDKEIIINNDINNKIDNEEIKTEINVENNVKISDIENLNQKILNMENNIKNIYNNLKIKEDISDTAIEYIYKMNKIQNMLEIQSVKINEIINKKVSDPIQSPVSFQDISLQSNKSTQVNFDKNLDLNNNLKFGNELSNNLEKDIISNTNISNENITPQITIPNSLDSIPQIINPVNDLKDSDNTEIQNTSQNTNNTPQNTNNTPQNNIEIRSVDTSDEDLSIMSDSENLTDEEKREFDEIEKQLFHHLKLVLGDKKLDLSNIINIVIDLMKFIDYFNIVNKNKKEIILYTIKKYFNQIDNNEIHNQFLDMLPSMIDMFISIDKKKIKIRKPKLSCMFPMFS